MGLSAASRMFCLTLMLGLVKEDSMAVGLAGSGTPDFEAFEDLLKNVSKHREPGKECFQISFKLCYNSHMHYITKTHII